MPRVEISLNFMPAFYHRHLGLRYGEAYYFDPGYRADVEKAEGRFLHEVLGRHGVGAVEPLPSTSIFIQPVDLIMRTQNAEWRFPVDGTVESWGTPWKGLTPDEIVRIDARAAARHPVIDAILEQYRVLQRLYGDKADIFGIKTGEMVIHSPYTAAHQLYGEELFVVLLTEPAVADLIFGKVWEIYQAIFQRLCDATGARLKRIHLGDCSAALLSAATYRETVLPWNRKLAASFDSAGYHSCGSSTHHLPAFATLPKLTHIQLGAGTDLRQAAALLPGIHMQPLLDPLLLRQNPPETVSEVVQDTLVACAPAPATTVCIWALDRDTPVANVDAVYTTVEKANAHA